MKRYLIMVMILITNVVIGQNFGNICTEGITFFKNSQSELKGFRLDSIILPGMNDTIFLSYRSIIDTGGTCSDTTHGSILGLRVYRKSNGWFYFLNRNNDSIRINSQASLNESWKFIDLQAGAYIQAKVTGIITDSLLGTTDMVKIISFQAKDAGNNNIGHILNQEYIKLSQHYGLTRMFHVYYIPDDTVEYMLAGKSHPAIGIQEISWKDVYNFDIGDVFHYAGYGSDPVSSAVWSRRELVIDKVVYGNNDSVLYQIERCVSEEGGPPPFSNTWIDTVTVKYNFIQLANDASFLRLPEEFVNDFFYASDYSRSLGFNHQRQTKSTNFNIWSNTEPLHNCWSVPYLPYSIQAYTEGLGHTYNHLAYSWDYLVYYKKGSESWGTPVTTDCGIALGTDPTHLTMDISIEIIPNPVEYHAEINLEGYGSYDNLKYDLYNYSGQLIKKADINSRAFTLDRSGFPGGIYLLIIHDKSGEIKGRKKIIFL